MVLQVTQTKGNNFKLKCSLASLNIKNSLCYTELQTLTNLLISSFTWKYYLSSLPDVQITYIVHYISGVARLFLPRAKFEDSLFGAGLIILNSEK